MKKLFTTLVAVLSFTSLFAQSPQKMNYQAIIRDVSGNVIANHAIGIRISILKNTSPVYVETQATTSNTSGIITIEIGGGTFVSGVSFASIDLILKLINYDVEEMTDKTNYVLLQV